MDSQQRSAQARSAWLPAIAVAMFAALISPTPAWAQPTRTHGCERVPFATFYTLSVEGVSQDRLVACAAGGALPANRVFRSWQESPRLLAHLRRINPLLADGVTRESIPSAGALALANFDALIARCDPAESDSSDAGVPEAGDAAVEDTHPSDADAPRIHRRRAHLSRSAMEVYPWNPSAWFSRRECAGRRSIEVRPAEVVRMMTNVRRTDEVVVSATHLLANPTRNLSEAQSVALEVRTRLTDPQADPVPASLFPPLASACLTTLTALHPTCFTATPDESAAPVADASVTGELARLRAENGRLTRENQVLRASSKSLPKTLASWLGILALLVLVAFTVSDLIKRARPTPTPKVDQEIETPESSLAVILPVATAVEGRDSSSLTILPPAPAMDEATQQHFETKVIPALFHKWELEERRHFETMITRHRGKLAEEVGKRRTVEEERDRCLAALNLLQKSVALPDTDTPSLTFSYESGDDALVPSVEGSGAPLSSTAISNDLWEPAPIKPTDAAIKLLHRLAKFASDYIVGDDPRREILSSPEHAATAEEVDACSQAAFDVITQWRRQIEAFDQPLGSDPDHRDTLSMLEHASPEAAANPNGAGPSKHDTLPGGFPVAVIQSAEPK